MIAALDLGILSHGDGIHASLPFSLSYITSCSCIEMPAETEHHWNQKYFTDMYA
jgi:hypothetical protein